ncbi:hypothetical protein [Natrarchaeobius chitinivorans]|uniref:Uncharacterized protein n=1 Tax=Natrarchaeobius chitinivorans TaxID=1679083 RepID=A0A3N6NGC0_NATCH|nr:hypothetical protein [Natrarchaeobius chitinivorans]RQG98062.1 hypothetical protein EA473_02415 [Natrarchaeobius chitinivorans]
MTMLRRLWKRHVTGRPDQYRAYVSFPSATDGTLVADVHERVEELEHAFEGRLDVYARLQGIAVVTDRVPADEFDVTAFEAILDRIEDAYRETHRLVCLEKWRSIDGRLVRSYVVVPVKPLFPSDPSDRREIASSSTE